MNVKSLNRKFYGKIPSVHSTFTIAAAMQFVPAAAIMPEIITADA